MPLDWSQCPAVESIPGKVSGACVFKNRRMLVSRPGAIDEVRSCKSSAIKSSEIEVQLDALMSLTQFASNYVPNRAF